MVFVSNYHGPLDLSTRVKVGHVFVLASGFQRNHFNGLPVVFPRNYREGSAFAY